MRGKILIVLLLLCGTTLTGSNPKGENRQVGSDPRLRSEYELKAVMITIFPTYLQWPEGPRVNDKSKPFVIGVIGENPFKGWLKKLCTEKKILNKEATVRYLAAAEEIGGCDLLFVAKSVELDLPKILAAVKNKPILTVGDTPGFAHKGVHINFYIEKGATRFEVNVRALFDANFSPNFRLLKLARVVITEGRHDEKR